MLLLQVAELQELRDLVKRLLTHSPSQRLGSLKGGALDVKAHPWFKDFDWESFEKQTMPAPYIPKVSLARLQLEPWWPRHDSKDAQAADSGHMPGNRYCAQSGLHMWLG